MTHRLGPNLRKELFIHMLYKVIIKKNFFDREIYNVPLDRNIGDN